MVKKQETQTQYSIEPEFELGEVVFAVYAWENGDAADPSGIDTTIRKQLVGSFMSYELAHQRYPDAVSTRPAALLMSGAGLPGSRGRRS